MSTDIKYMVLRSGYSSFFIAKDESGFLYIYDHDGTWMRYSDTPSMAGRTIEYETTTLADAIVYTIGLYTKDGNEKSAIAWAAEL